jgi:hypothetical protein
MIGAEINDRIADAVGPQEPPRVVDALVVARSGATLQAGMGHSDNTQMGERLVSAARLILGGTR